MLLEHPTALVVFLLENPLSHPVSGCGRAAMELILHAIGSGRSEATNNTIQLLAIELAIRRRAMPD